MDDNISLKVRRGAQVFGPMSLVQLAELLASGRVAETDEVSADGRQWQSITAYFEQQLKPVSPPPADAPAGSDDDDFLPTFDDAAPSEPPSTLFDDEDFEEAPPAPARKPASPKKPAPARSRLIDDDDLDEDDEEDGANLDDVLRQLLEHERKAPALNESRASNQPAARARGGAPATAPPLKMTSKERVDGFVMMFNGRNFSGWRFGESSALPDKLPDNWKVERGCIRLTGGGKPSCMSQWDYADFDFRFAWRATAEQYNGGLCLRSGRKVGMNQISLRRGEEGAFPGGEIDGAENAAGLQKPPGEWNEWRVVAASDGLTLWCNGKRAWQARGLEPQAGYLGFLAAGAPLEFANLRIKETGWEYLNDLQKHWSPADGRAGRWKQMGDSIVGEKGKSVPLETVVRDYRDYVLRFDWKPTAAATGTLYLRGADCDKAAVQLGGAGAGSGGFPALGVSPAEALDNPGGQWNFMEVQLVNNAASIRLNGDDAVRNVRLPRGAAPATGPIALSHNGRPIQVRNIRLKLLN